MNIRVKHAVNPATQAEYDNEFIAVDEEDRVLGACRVDSMFCKRLFPARPHQICIEFTGDKAARSALLGAADAQAMLYALRENMPARIYSPCEPDDTERIVQLNELGYEDNDGIVRMAKFIEAMPENPEIPNDVIVLHDRLEDPAEARFFLKRYNRLYGINDTMDLVDEWTALPGFRRYLIIHQRGLLGEVLVALQGNVGRILFIQVNAEYCRCGLGRYLMELAIFSLARRGAERIDMDVRVRIPGLMRFLTKLGFVQNELIERYLGIDWNPGAMQKAMNLRPLPENEPEEQEEWEVPDIKGEAPIAQDPEDWD